jgi:hypothetical protein
MFGQVRHEADRSRVLRHAHTHQHPRVQSRPDKRLRHLDRQLRESTAPMRRAHAQAPAQLERARRHGPRLERCAGQREPVQGPLHRSTCGPCHHDQVDSKPRDMIHS